MRHFGSKEGLLFAVVDHCFAQWEDEVLMPLLGGGTGPESIAEVVRSHVAFVRESPAVGRLFFVLLFEGLGSQPKLLERYRALHQRFRSLGTAWLERAVAAASGRSQLVIAADAQRDHAGVGQRAHRRGFLHRKPAQRLPPVVGNHLHRLCQVE